MRSRSHGLRVGPKRVGSVVGRIPYSGSFVVPTMTNPGVAQAAHEEGVVLAAMNSPVTAPRRTVSRLPGDRRLFLIAIGTPANGRSSPGPTASAAASARIGVDVDERVDLAVERLDALERGLDELAGGDLAAAHQRGELVGRTEEEIAHRAQPTCRAFYAFGTPSKRRQAS